jgi:phosphatidylinositol alpha 1,6-mannosyltransferase
MTKKGQLIALFYLIFAFLYNHFAGYCHMIDLGDNMVYKTHVKIAQMVIERLSETEINYISRTEFIKGSNHPDYDLNYRMMKHSLEGSIQEVHRLLKDVTEVPQSRYDLGFKVGIIAHFLADYMCSYHSNPFYNRKNIATHIRYEQKLHQHIEDVFTFEEQLFKSMKADDLIHEMSDFIMTHMHTVEISMRKDFSRAVSLVYRMVKLVLHHIVPVEKTTYLFDSPMRVAIFTDTYYPQINGVSNTIYHYIEYLKQQQIPYVLISPKYKELMHNKEKGHHILRVKSMSFWFYKESKIAFPNKKVLERLLNDFNPTIIHSMTEFSIGHAGLKYGKKHHIPVMTNYSTHFMDYLKYMKLGVFFKPLKRYVKWFHNQAQVTTCPSSMTKAYLHQMGIENTHLFGRGIHTEQFSPKYRDEAFRKQFGSSPFIYLYVGRVSAEKELELALDAFLNIKQKYSNTHFVVVGGGPKKELYEKQYKNVHFLGYQTGEELSTIYASCDVFVFPSPTETLGNVVLEAMASGLPVITANQGGVLENVRHMQNGMLAATQEVSAYEKLMKMYYLNRMHYQTMQQQALKEMHQKSWKSIFVKQLQAYDSIIKKTRELT